jgi:sec-independent protein translocase protein TatC
MTDCPVDGGVQIPALAEQPVLAVGFALTVLFWLGTVPAMAYWAASEAGARAGSALWTFVYLTTGFGALHYAYVRFVQADMGARDIPPARRERLAAAYVVAAPLAFLAGAVVSPPDPVTQILAFPPLFVVTLAATVLLVTRGPLADESEAAA